MGDNLPVAEVVQKAGESGATEDIYNVDQLCNYLGSFNALDTVSLCIRPQEQTTDSILAVREQGVANGVNAADMDSVNAAGFKSIPDASGLRRTESSHDGMNEMADMGDSPNSMPEFNLILSILVDTFISKISLLIQPIREIGSISDA